jgi:AcrR family transcriptional regulator
MRVERFLDAATEVFIEKGYQHARLSEIVARAGGSLATLYRVFGDKEGLARAIILRRLQDLNERMQTLNLSGLPPKDALFLAAERIAQGMTTTEMLVVHRIAIGEGQSFPDLRDWFFDHAVASVRGSVSDYFEQEMAAGRLRIASASMASSQFFMMLFGDLVIRISCGNLRDPDPEELRNYALGAVDLFLHGALPR